MVGANPTVVWLILMIICGVIELGTAGLTTIWFALGSFIALLVSLTGVGEGVQIAVFLIVSFLSLILARPLAVKFMGGKRVKTNYETVIGEVVRVTEQINNIDGTGKAVVNGQEWTARAIDDGMIIPEGALVEVTEVSGVKLIVKPIATPVTQG